MKAVFRASLSRLFEHQVSRLIARHHLKVVAVAGSVGKTGTRMAVATVLSEKYRTPRILQPGYNSEIGLPLSVFGMETPAALLNPLPWIWRLIKTERVIHSQYPYELLVLELGTDHPGEIARYIAYLSPTLGIMTAVTPEHMQNFPGGLAQVAAEELLLATTCDTFLASNDDIPAFYRHKYIDKHPQHHFFGMGKSSEYGVTILADEPILGMQLALTKNTHSVAKTVQTSLHGETGAKMAAAAFAAGDLMGLTRVEITAGLKKLRAVPGRMNVLEGIEGTTIIDDTYNSSPAAVRASLEALAAWPTTGRRIAVLGSMNELGTDGPKYHTEAGVLAAGVDMLVTVGDLANRYLAPAAVRAGLDPTASEAAASPYAAGQYLKLIVRPGDVILAKGSQNGVFCEEAVKLLLANPEDANLLVRQSPSWHKAKARQFGDATE
jgi:UDP-N-acetylmuramoyl-tripeptide--D-alanyl-D-alanine ligase